MTSQVIALMILLSSLSVSVACTDETTIDSAPYLAVQEEIPLADRTKQGHLLLKLFPVAGAVYVDRYLVGAAASGETLDLSLAPGLHELVVSRSGYHDSVSTIRIKTGEARSALVSLVALRQHLFASLSHRQIRPGMTARGQLTITSTSAAATFEKLGVKLKPALAGACAIQVDLLDTPSSPFEVRVANFGSRLNIYVVDDEGRVVGKSLAKTWSPRFRVTPQEKRKYTVILAHAAMAKNDAFNLVRYAVYLTPVVAQKK